MVFVAFTVRLAIAVLALLVGATAVCIDRRRLVRAGRQFRPRFREVAPHLGLLAVILLVNTVAREAALTVSWVFDVNVSGLIYAVEGDLVATIQTVQRPVFTAYFSFMYIAGYIGLLVFPFVAYFVLEDRRFLQQTAIAYATNYGIGLVCYLAIVSYGPRNVIPDLVNQPLFSTYPAAQVVTGRWNANTNVFPSLHTSLATTVALLAHRTRDAYPRWQLLAAGAATSVVISTMYLGIHWATDVVAGVLLGTFSVWFAGRRRRRGSPDRAGWLSRRRSRRDS